MHPTLTKALDAVGILPKSRFSIEEVAEVLGLQRHQVIDLLKKGKLVGMKSSSHRWRSVFAEDLDAFFQKVNAPRQVTGKAPDTSQDRVTTNLKGMIGEPKRFIVPPPLESPLSFSALTDHIRSPGAGLPMPIPSQDSPISTTKRELDL